jgi:hypothetical protein
MKITVTVTEDHVKNQRRAECASCAFALAINEKLAEPFHANIFHNLRIENWAGDPVYRLKLPYDIRNAIIHLDEQLEIDLPFSFTAIIPGKYLKPKPQILNCGSAK